MCFDFVCCIVLVTILIVQIHTIRNLYNEYLATSNKTKTEIILMVFLLRLSSH